jgi:hypothetical protein
MVEPIVFSLGTGAIGSTMAGDGFGWASRFLSGTIDGIDIQDLSGRWCPLVRRGMIKKSVPCIN